MRSAIQTSKEKVAQPSEDSTFFSSRQRPILRSSKAKLQKPYSVTEHDLLEMV
jgi:hypothetical protein